VPVAQGVNEMEKSLNSVQRDRSAGINGIGAGTDRSSSNVAEKPVGTEHPNR